MLYRHTICTTVPQRIRNKDPHANLDMEQLNNRASQSTSYHDRHSWIKSPFYAGQTVSVLNDAKTLWLPTTILRQADHGSYLIKVVGGGTYRRARDHIRERHPKAMKKQSPMQENSSPGNVAPAMPEWPGAPPVHSQPAVMSTAPVAPATVPLPTVPTVKISTPCKAAAHTPVHPTASSTGVASQQTGAAPAALCWSAHTHKPPTRLITEMY